MADEFTTCAGLGIGLPGSRGLMDEYAFVCDAKRRTAVTMTIWSGKEGNELPYPRYLPWNEHSSPDP